MNLKDLPLKEFRKETKKAAHSYAMHIVKEPFANKDAVEDVQETFYYGAMEYKLNIDKTIAPQNRLTVIDEIVEQAYRKFHEKNYFSGEQSEELQRVIKEDIMEGVKWAITNWSKPQ